MLPKEVSLIKLSDFENLISAKVFERKDIEYKQELHIAKDADRKEFLYDVSSFANAEGGDLIIGISEDRTTGAPISVSGIIIQNSDALKRQIESIIRDGVEPRISDIQIETFHTQGDSYILLIRIPKSKHKPHQVIFNGVDRFYSRGNAGKYKLNVHELRQFFTNSIDIDDNVKGLKTLRQQFQTKIISNETPVILLNKAKIIIQYFPLNILQSEAQYDLSLYNIDNSEVRPLGKGGWQHQYNVHGFMSYRPAYDVNRDMSTSYLQLYRNGIIETVNTDILAPYDGRLFIPSLSSIDFEGAIIQSFKDCISLYKRLNVQLPIYSFITLAGIKGYELQSSRVAWRLRSPPKINQDIISTELIIANFNFDVEKELRPFFNIIWNACGIEKSRNYDDMGKWMGPLLR